MQLPTLTYPDRLPTDTRNELELLVSQLQRTLRSIFAPIDVPYDPSNFTAAGAMTWDVARGDQKTYGYTVVNKRLWLDVYLDTTSISGTPSGQLFVAIPGGYVAARTVQVHVPLFDNGVAADAYARVMDGDRQVEIGRMDLAALTASTRNTYVRCSMNFPVR